MLKSVKLRSVRLLILHVTDKKSLTVRDKKSQYIERDKIEKRYRFKSFKRFKVLHYPNSLKSVKA